MHTQLLSVTDDRLMDHVRRAFAAQLPIAVPTDTVYGLSCPYDSAAGIAALYRIKERPRGKAIPILLGATEQLPQVARPFHSEVAAALAARFWPGPLTIILPAQPHLPAVLLAGGDTVAVRVVDHPAFQSLALQLGPLATTSANVSGQPDCSHAREVYRHLRGRIPLIVNAGRSPESRPSTIVKVTRQDVAIVRPGSLAPAIREFLAA